MNVINIGTEYNIYKADSVNTYKELLVNTYKVIFHKMKGYYLEAYDGLDVTEKVYGVHQSKVDKVVNSFSIFERSLGVILSGDKGIGKSLFTKMLAQTCLAKNIPVLIVDRWVPGIGDFLDTIEQEVMVLFDEFDKTFVENSEGGNSPQTELLSLFDGISTRTKRLYVITCNQLNKINEYLINRPGRFHYHFRFAYPDKTEIELYLKDKLKPEYYDQIREVIAFAGYTDLNYDCLRAIAFELNTGIPFKAAIQDLNILNIDNKSTYTMTVKFTDGSSVVRKCRLNMTDSDLEHLWFAPEGCDSAFIRICFTPAKATWSMEFDAFLLKDVDIESSVLISEIDDDEQAFYDEYKTKIVAYATLVRHAKIDDLHYKLSY